LFTTIRTCFPDANPGRRDGKPASNGLSYGTALRNNYVICFLLCYVLWALQQHIRNIVEQTNDVSRVAKETVLECVDLFQIGVHLCASADSGQSFHAFLEPEVCALLLGMLRQSFTQSVIHAGYLISRQSCSQS
jgi:hypothetical protein